MSVLTRTKAPAKGMDRRRSLAGIPILNETVSIDREDENNWEISVALKRGKGFFARFQPATMTRRVKLDELGTFVVNQINGRRSVLEIIETFVTRFKINRREAELSVVAFLKSLAGKHVISILIK